MNEYPDDGLGKLNGLDLDELGRKAAAARAASTDVALSPSEVYAAIYWIRSELTKKEYWFHRYSDRRMYRLGIRFRRCLRWLAGLGLLTLFGVALACGGQASHLSPARSATPAVTASPTPDLTATPEPPAVVIAEPTCPDGTQGFAGSCDAGQMGPGYPQQP